jgi:peptide/nickel transport system substrate-binding protein
MTGPSTTRRQLLKSAAALPLAAAVTHPATAQQASADGMLVVAVQTLPPSLEPGIDYSNVGWRLFANMFDTLIGYDFARDFAPVPRLAERWRRIDERTLELTLREGAVFHNGDPVTAADVAFTFGPERMTGERAPTRVTAAPFLGTIAGAAAIDARTVRIMTTAPDPLLEVRLASLPASIVNRRAFLAAADFDAWQRAPVGSGPYRLRTYRQDTEVVLDGIENHWGGRPAARAIRFWVIPEVAARVAAVRSGAAHIATDIPPDQEAALRGVADVEFVGGPIANHRVLVYDTTNPVLRDPRVRRALGLAIDRELIVQTLWGGKVEVPRSHQFAAFREMFIADWPKPAYDPERAKALLREAGYAGQAIEYRFIGSGYYINEVQTAQVLSEMWRAVGLNVQLRAVENFSQVYLPQDRGIRNWSNTMALPDPVGGLWRLYGPRGPLNTTTREWRNEEFNTLGATLETSLDMGARRAAWQRMLAIYDEADPPGTVLHQFAMFYVKRREVDWRPLPTEWMDFRPDYLRTMRAAAR